MARLEWKQGMDTLDTIPYQRRIFRITSSISYTIRADILECESTRIPEGNLGNVGLTNHHKCP
eukprot:10715685-Prorocentrum_lima.AAC.1